MSETAFLNGEYQNDYKGRTPGEWPIKVENYKGEPIGIWTHKKWKSEMFELMGKFQRVLDGQELPKWEDIPYRSEKDFRGGIFSNFVDMWVPIINQLPTETEKVLTYKLIHEGLAFSDNQEDIPPENHKMFRQKTRLCTANDVNKTYEDKIEKGVKAWTDQNKKE